MAITARSSSSTFHGRALVPAPQRLGRPLRAPVHVAALFGFGKSDDKEREKQAAFEAQQRVIEARRSGRAMDKANERRKKVSEYIREEREAREVAWREGKNVQMPGKKGKSTIDQIREQYGDDSNSGIVVPLAPFGIPKYDQGERFDLQAPYADKGYVDPDYKGPLDALKGLFGGSKKEKGENK